MARAVREGLRVRLIASGVRYGPFASVAVAEAVKNFHNNQPESDVEAVSEAQVNRIPVRVYDPFPGSEETAAFNTYCRSGALLVDRGTDTDGVMLVSPVYTALDGIGEGEMDVVGVWSGLREWEVNSDKLGTTNQYSGYTKTINPSFPHSREGWMVTDGYVQARINGQSYHDGNGWIVSLAKSGQLIGGGAYTNFNGGGAYYYHPTENVPTTAIAKGVLRAIGASPWIDSIVHKLVYFSGPFTHDWDA